MQKDFKRVPAVYKCFNIIERVATSKEPLSISEIASELGYYRSTVFNMANSLVDLGIFRQGEDGKFSSAQGFIRLEKQWIKMRS